MPTTINASNTTGGAVVTGDGSGILELQSGGVTGITVNGANVTVAGTFTATGGIPQVTTALTSPVAVIGNSTAGAEIRLPEDTDNGSNYVAIKAPDSLAGNVTFTLPTADGTSGQLIQTNGSGQLSFTNPTSLASPLAVVGNSTAGAEIRLPEDTDNGSNYVALKAADSLASNVILTLPSADGTSGQYLQTNGSGQLSFSTVASGTTTFTASGSITAGKPVALNTNGTVSTVTGVNQIETWGAVTAGTGYAISTSRSVGFFDTTTGWHIHPYQDSSTGSVYVYAFKLDSSGAVSVSNNVTLSSPGGLVNRMSLCKGSTGNVYALMYTSDTLGNSIRFFEMTNTSTGALTSRNAISFGGSQNNRWWGDCYYDSNADRVVAFYNDGSAALGITAINYNNNSPTSTATSSTSLGTTIGQNASLAAAYNTSTNTGRVFYGDPSNSYVGLTRIITLNGAGTSFTVGSSVQFEANNCQYGMRAAYFPNINRFVAQYPVNNYASFLTRTIVPSTGAAESGTSSVPSGAPSQFGTYGFSSGYDFVNNIIYNVYVNGTLTPFNYTVSLSGIAYSAGTATTDSGTYDWIGCAGVSFDQTNIRVGVSVASNSQGQSYRRGYIPPFFSTNAYNFVGLSTATVANGQTVSVTTIGGTNTSQTGLTTGTTYYVTYDGLISTTGLARVGLALSATSMYVEDGIPPTWIPVASITLTSGQAAGTFTNIPTSYSDIMFVFNNISFTNSTTLYMAISGDNSSFSSSSQIQTTGQTSNIYGGVTMFNYQQMTGTMLAFPFYQTGAPAIGQASGSSGLWGWRSTGGIKAVRFTPSSYAFSSGTITMYAR